MEVKASVEKTQGKEARKLIGFTLKLPYMGKPSGLVVIGIPKVLIS